jgi:hypothetical protein
MSWDVHEYLIHPIFVLKNGCDTYLTLSLDRHSVHGSGEALFADSAELSSVSHLHVPLEDCAMKLESSSRYISLRSGFF